MIICCEVLLAATSPEGKLLATKGTMDLALAGAALTELAASQRLAVKDDRLVVLDPRSVGDPLLDHALEVLAQKAGKKPAKALPPLAKGMTDRIYQRLVAEGAVGEEKGGFLRSTKHPVIDAATREALLEGGGRVLAGSARPDLHTGSLVALLGAADAVTKVYDASRFEASGRQLKKRAQEIGKEDWAAGAAAAAIKSAQDAMIAVMTATTVATTMSSSNN